MPFPLLFDREELTEDPPKRVHHHNGDTVVAFPSLVPPALMENLVELPCYSQTVGSIPPAGGARTATASRLQSIGEHHKAT